MNDSFQKGKLYLIPTLMGESEVGNVLPSGILPITNCLDVFLVEKAKSARRFLRKLGFTKEFDDLEFHELNKRTSDEDKFEHIQLALQGKNIGILSEAGCPGIADPGSDVVKMAHELGITVVPLVGPSSILLTVMASGLNGQSFAFNGYLPIDKKERVKAIQRLERLSAQNTQTQLFIETPYRNDALLDDLKKTLHPNTQLCVAADITNPSEWIKTMSISSWKKQKEKLNKRPAVFALLGQ